MSTTGQCLASCKTFMERFGSPENSSFHSCHMVWINPCSLKRKQNAHPTCCALEPSSLGLEEPLSEAGLVLSLCSLLDGSAFRGRVPTNTVAAFPEKIPGGPPGLGRTLKSLSFQMFDAPPSPLCWSQAAVITHGNVLSSGRGTVGPIQGGAGF